jgi:hypothetical protein
MPLPSSGQLAIDQIGVEFLGSAPYSLSQYYRGGGRVANSPQNVNVPTSGAVSFNNFYNAQLRSVNSLTIAANTNNYDVKTALGSAYFAGYTDVTVTIGSGVVVGSASQANPAMTVTGFASGDTVAVTNNGTIRGAGGPGGTGSNAVTPVNAVAGGQGGAALSVSFATSVANNGTIAGGGGGGGGGSGRRYTVGSGKTASTVSRGGGGGGGGAGTIVGAAGGGGANSGNTGAAGAATTGGAGGAAADSAGAGGAGGALGAAGSSGTTGAATVRGAAAGGGAAGNYIVGNANVTWIVNGTRIGGVA